MAGQGRRTLQVKMNCFAWWYAESTEGKAQVQDSWHDRKGARVANNVSKCLDVIDSTVIRLPRKIYAAAFLSKVMK